MIAGKEQRKLRNLEIHARMALGEIAPSLATEYGLSCQYIWQIQQEVQRRLAFEQVRQSKIAEGRKRIVRYAPVLDQEVWTPETQYLEFLLGEDESGSCRPNV